MACYLGEEVQGTAAAAAATGRDREKAAECILSVWGGWHRERLSMEREE